LAIQQGFYLVGLYHQDPVNHMQQSLHLVHLKALRATLDLM